MKLIRACPDEWILNKMPSTDIKKELANEYFIFNGERKEIKDYDVKWIRNNCEIKGPMSVY